MARMRLRHDWRPKHDPNGIGLVSFLPQRTGRQPVTEEPLKAGVSMRKYFMSFSFLFVVSNEPQVA